MLNEKRLTKTEYEYYSRKAKKKLNAIVYLQELSRAVVASIVSCSNLKD